MNLEKLLSQHFVEKYKINLNDEYSIEMINARELIVPDRIDLISKIKYVEFKDKGYNLEFVKEVYSSQIEAFSMGTFSEPGDLNKNNLHNYFDTFDNLIEDIKLNGVNKDISIIPVGKDNIILNGAHRTAIAAYYNMEVPIIRFTQHSVKYDVKYFRERLMDESHLNYLTVEYCKLKDNVYFSCIWPVASKNINEDMKGEINQIYSKYGKQVLIKEIDLSYEALHSLIAQIYSHHSWVGTPSNNFMGAHNKAKACYTNNASVFIYVFECNDFQNVLRLKQEIREVFKLGNHSIHITDNREETIQIANLLLNSNSIKFLERGTPTHYLETYYRIIKFQEELTKLGENKEEYLVNSSSLLALHGLREARDLDYLSINNGCEIIDNEFFGNHNAYLNYFNKPLETLIFDPRNYFVYRDIKFVTLENLRIFKKNRNENKDQIDIKLIDTVLKSLNEFKKIQYRLHSHIKRKKVYFMHSLKRRFITFIMKIGLFNITKKIYRYVYKKI